MDFPVQKTGESIIILMKGNKDNMGKLKYLIFVLLLPFQSCNTQIKEYSFRYLVGSTGIQTHLIDKNREIAIKYHPDSLDIDSFLALKWNILNANTENQIIVSGVLYPEILQTSIGTEFPEQEEYQFFRLNKWYIKVPFNKMNWKNGKPMDEMIFSTHFKLTENDFKDFPGKIDFDYNAHVKTK